MSTKEYQKKWYQQHKEEVKARSKRYYAEHKEQQAAKQKERYERNKETILARQKEYRDTHKEQIAETAKKYRDNGGYKRHHEKYKEKRNAQFREYYKVHREELNAHHRDFMKGYRETKEGLAMIRIGNYRKEDKRKGRGECTLTQDWFIKNIFEGACVYCGDTDFKHLGADRVDNSLPHTPDNCICACGVCNVERENKGMSVEEFKEYRKHYPRTIDLKPEIVEINGNKVLRKRC